MKKISLSIIPTYWCKTNCKHCYLGDLRKDQTTLDLQCLENKLHQLVENDYTIDSISVYGGEISLLDEQYLIQIVKIIRSHVSNQVTIGFCTSGYNRSIFELAEYLKVRVTIPLNQETGLQKESTTYKTTQLLVGRCRSSFDYQYSS